MRRAGVAIHLLLASLAIACTAKDEDVATPPPMSYETAHMRLVTGADTNHLLVELAKSAEQQTMGLMARPHLADSAGMLFPYAKDQPDSSAFWMFRTLIPLDIGFMDSTGVIRSVVRMEPCTATIAQGCQTYPARVPFRAALEVNAGYFAQHKVAVGSRLLLGDTLNVDSKPTNGTRP